MYNMFITHRHVFINGIFRQPNKICTTTFSYVIVIIDVDTFERHPRCMFDFLIKRSYRSHQHNIPRMYGIVWCFRGHCYIF